VGHFRSLRPDQLVHRRASHLHLAGPLRVVRSELGAVPSEDCHHLLLGRSILCSPNRADLAQAVRGAMGQAGVVAPFSEPVAEAVRREGLAVGRDPSRSMKSQFVG